MRYLIMFFILLFIFGCGQRSVPPASPAASVQVDKAYRLLLDSLKHYGGYLNFDITIKLEEGKIKGREKDSLLRLIAARKSDYEVACKHFFAQDTTFIHWLLQFRYDTTHRGLWNEYVSPLSSRISNCSLGLNNSAAAANLLLNFLEGRSISCYACGEKDVACLDLQYGLLLKFLSANKGKTVMELRESWALHTF